MGVGIFETKKLAVLCVFAFLAFTEQGVVHESVIAKLPCAVGLNVHDSVWMQKSKFRSKGEGDLFITHKLYVNMFVVVCHTEARTGSVIYRFPRRSAEVLSHDILFDSVCVVNTVVIFERNPSKSNSLCNFDKFRFQQRLQLLDAVPELGSL